MPAEIIEIVVNPCGIGTSFIVFNRQVSILGTIPNFFSWQKFD